jgi:hypothetical protein
MYHVSPHPATSASASTCGQSIFGCFAQAFVIYCFPMRIRAMCKNYVLPMREDDGCFVCLPGDKCQDHRQMTDRRLCKSSIHQLPLAFDLCRRRLLLLASPHSSREAHVIPHSHSRDPNHNDCHSVTKRYKDLLKGSGSKKLAACLHTLFRCSRRYAQTHERRDDGKQTITDRV